MFLGVTNINNFYHLVYLKTQNVCLALWNMFFCIRWIAVISSSGIKKLKASLRPTRIYYIIYFVCVWWPKHCVFFIHNKTLEGVKYMCHLTDRIHWTPNTKTQWPICDHPRRAPLDNSVGCPVTEIYNGFIWSGFISLGDNYRRKHN